MQEYQQFVEELKSKLRTFENSPQELWKDIALKYVNGYAETELRRLVGIDKRREYGAFFTESTMALNILNILAPEFDNNSVIYDPAVGAGNLLIATAEYISKFNANLGYQLFGTDIHSEFIEAAKLRLSMYFLLKNVDNNSQYKAYELLLQDGLDFNGFYKKATHIIANPPFNLITSNNKLKWAKGKVSAAALFMDKIIEHSNNGVSIIAILPDVLRSGTRYEKWRVSINNRCVINKIYLYGQFDNYADVDVFAIRLTKREIPLTANNDQLEEIQINNNNTIDNLFDVCVGPVVDNRDLHSGVNRGYVISRGLPGWGEEKKVKYKRKHEGKCFQSPFVVVKRTSRMSDSYRAIGTIINDPEPTYVDNHLIVLMPKSKKLEDCKKILAILKSEATNKWLNEKIRCRHLTVKVVSKIPIL